MKKTKELISLNRDIQGAYIAGCYDATKTFSLISVIGVTLKRMFFIFSEIRKG